MASLNLNREYKLYDAVAPRLPLCGQLITDIVERANRRLYVVGERHGTRDAIDYVHNHVVPLIKSAPDTWLLLREGLESYADMPDETLLGQFPDFLYFRKLPTLLTIPADDPIGVITSSQTQQNIQSVSDLNVDEMRGWYITSFIHVNQAHMSGRKLRTACAQDLGINEDEMQQAEKYAFDRSVHERLMPAWNKATEKKLETILLAHPQRSNILVSAGAAHLGAFSSKFTYIG